MASGPDNYDTFFSPGGEPSGPTKGPDRTGSNPPSPSRASTERNYGETEGATPTGPGITNPSTSGATKSWGPHPGVPAQVAALGDKLVQLQIITRDQWNEACHRAAGLDHIELVVKELQSMPSDRKTRGEAPLPALTEFQSEAILQNQVRRLRLGPYLLIDRIGAGGMGEVFRGWNLNLDRIEAIKTITSDEVTGSTIGLARFDREARVLAQLDHPCITTIYSTGREDGAAYIAMEYVRGKTLVQRVKDSKAKDEQVPVAWAVDVMKEVASALDHAHSSGVIHRDIKPNNIMVTHDGEVRVLDMGIARLVSGGGSGAGMTGLTRHVAGMGTPEVMPPEQWADATTVSPASDIYSLGCTFFYLLAGRMPFDATDLHGMMSSHLTVPPPDIRDFRPDAPSRLADVLKKMMAKDAGDRFRQCGDLIEALESCREEIDSKGAIEDEEEPPRPGSWWPWAAAAGVLLAGLSLAGYALWSRPDYEKQVAQFLAAYQKDNSDQWPSVRALQTAVEKGPYATVDSSEKLKQFEEWVEDETSRRRDSDFGDWIDEQQRKHSDVWPSEQSLQAVVDKEDRASASTPDDFAALRKRIEDQTRIREDLQGKAKAQIAKAIADHPDLWNSSEEVEKVADGAVALSSIADDRDIERRQAAIDAEARKLMAPLEEFRRQASEQVKAAYLAADEAWENEEEIAGVANAAVPIESVRKKEDLVRRQEAIDKATREHFGQQVLKALTDYQSDNKDVWKELKNLTDWANQKTPLDEISSSQGASALMDLVDKETVKRRARDWVQQFRREHQAAWKDANTINTFMDSRFPNGVESSATKEEMEAAVRAETERLMKVQVEEWAKELVAPMPEGWPPVEWLTKPVFEQEDMMEWAGSDHKEKFLSIAKENANNGVFQAPLTPSDNPVADYERGHLLHELGWLLGLHRSGIASTGTVELFVEVDGKEVKSIPVGKQAEYSVKSSIPGYVTFLTFESPNRVMLFEWTEPLKAGVRTKLVALTPDVATSDRYMVYVTDKFIGAELPKPGEGVKIEATNYPDYLPGLLVPPVADATTKDGLKIIRASLPGPNILDELLTALWKGVAPEYVPAQPVRVWTRTEREIPAVAP